MHLSANAIYDISPLKSGERVLLLMLPGAKNTPLQLETNGFIRELRERDLAVDVLALDAHADLYLDRTLVERLLHDTLDNVRTHGYHRIWVLGISLGGTGAMLCATQRPAEIEGVILIAPFLGTRGIIAEIEAAGGLQRWQAGAIEKRDHERLLLAQIQLGLENTNQFPSIYLGYGSEDRYRGASIMISERLNTDCVQVLPGGHDWKTWIELWRKQLDKHPFVDWSVT